MNSATTEHLLKTDKLIDYRLELRTNHPGATEWVEYAMRDFKLTRDAFTPAILWADLVKLDPGFSDEGTTGTRTQLLAQARLTCVVDGNAEVLFAGRVQRVDPRDGGFAITCFDWLALINECDCDVNLSPDETAIDDNPRALSLIGDGRFGNVFGFTYQGTGDPAFNSGVDAGTRRRSWIPGNIRLYYDAAGTEEVPPLHYRINLTGGSATILEDTSGKVYYATGVGCYIEGTLDWAEVLQAALEWPKDLGGIGATAADLDLPDTGLDLAGPITFKGRVIDLVSRVQRDQQANLRLWYDSANERFKLRVVTQADRGQEDWQLCCPVSITQPREVRDMFTRVVVKGKCERPRNALTEPTTVITDITSEGDWFAWDGLNVGSDCPAGCALELLYDGDSNLGAGVHNLADTENGGTDKYDSWYGFIEVDLGEESRLDRVRATMPGSRNVNALAGHQGLFWPGIRVFGSLDGANWRLLTPLLYGRFEPNSVAEACAEELLMQRTRFLRFELGAYKHGYENQSDPSIGLAELEIYTAETYEVVREIQDLDVLGEYAYTDGSTWGSYHPVILEKLGGRQRTRHYDVAGALNEFLAHDYALDRLAESIRLFQQVTYLSAADPRIGLYDTAAGTDEMNGAITGILVERIELSPEGTRVQGTDYRSAELGGGEE